MKTYRANSSEQGMGLADFIAHVAVHDTEGFCSYLPTYLENVVSLDLYQTTRLTDESSYHQYIIVRPWQEVDCWRSVCSCIDY